MKYFSNWKRLEFKDCWESKSEKLNIFDLCDLHEAIYGEYIFDCHINNAEYAPKTSFVTNSAYVIVETDSPVINILFSLSSNNFVTFSTTGVSTKSGLSFMYSPYESDLWFPLDATIERINNGFCSFEMKMYQLCDGLGFPYRFMVYFPIFSSLDGFIIGIDNLSTLKPMREIKSKIVFIGGENTIGMGATTASFSIPNIVSRLANLEPIVLQIPTQSIETNIMNIESKGKNELTKYVIEYDKEVFEKGTELLIKTIRHLSVSKPKAKFVLWGWLEYLNYNEIFIQMSHLDNVKIIGIDEFEMTDFTFNANRIINDSGNVIIAKKICSLI